MDEYKWKDKMNREEREVKKAWEVQELGDKEMKDNEQKYERTKGHDLTNEAKFPKFWKLDDSGSHLISQTL
jgi:hypothetical protein